MLIDWAKWARNKSDPLSHIPNEEPMICKPCQQQRHNECTCNDTCQHRPVFSTIFGTGNEANLGTGYNAQLKESDEARD